MTAKSGAMGKSTRHMYFNKLFIDVSKGKATFEGEDFEEVTTFFKKVEKNWSSFLPIWKIFAVITVAAIVLFVMKINNTSEFALRYNEQAQNEVGQWVLAIIALGGVTLFNLFGAMVLRGRIKKWRGLLVSALREKVSGAELEPGAKAVHESLLRELGA
ncbi:MAG: hypothetical protein ACX94D_09350 [Henriciella sp.]|jgi:uncharacterized integral membrane protein